MSEFPYMSWWIVDYFADTSHLTCEQHGVYMILLGIAWQQPNGPGIPDDMPWLKRAFQAKCSDMHGNRFNRLVPPVLKAFFIKQSDARWQQFRQFSEWEKCKKRQRNAQENAAKRWLKTNNPKDLELALAMRPQSYGNANHIYKVNNKNSSLVAAREVETKMPRSRTVSAPATSRLPALDAAIAKTKQHNAPATPRSLASALPAGALAHGATNGTGNGKHPGPDDDDPIPF